MSLLEQFRYTIQKQDPEHFWTFYHLTFAFAWDPFDRIVLCFHSKMVKKDWLLIEHSQQLRWMRDEILEK